MRAANSTRRMLRRHRRPLAALLAGSAALIAMTSLRGSPAPTATAAPPPSTLGAHEVAIPVVLASVAVARILSEGDVIDVVSVPESDLAPARAEVVAPRARVLDVPDPASAFGTNSSAVVVLAVDEAAALRITEAAALGPISVLIRTRGDIGG